jgi:putative glutamine amidotransferase
MSARSLPNIAAERTRVGIPWRTSIEESANKREKLDYYFAAVRRAGADPVEISLVQRPEDLQAQLQELAGFVLPGSPTDVDPARYGAPRHLKTQSLDLHRDSTDETILDHAIRSSKAVFAICYGCQILNVHLKGTLIQDIGTQFPEALPHGKTDLSPTAAATELSHSVRLLENSRLAKLNRGVEAKINSSHHQAIDKLGEKLKATAISPDGIIEGVEWLGGENWVVGVQWHPERMIGDAFAEELFEDFVSAVRNSRNVMTHKA